jgi:methionyl-tRNA formyltransferase
MQGAAELIVTVVVDNESWILPWADKLVLQCAALGASATLVRKHADIPQGGTTFFLGCVKIATRETLARSVANLVVHASDLPKGRGFSPLSWLTIQGALSIPVCLLEASEKVDEGPIVFREVLHFEGHELIDEMRHALGEATVALCARYVAEGSSAPRLPQEGTATYFPRRRADDSRLDPTRTLAEQFDLLRTVDNRSYPAFFEMRGHRYVLRIEKSPEAKV